MKTKIIGIYKIQNILNDKVYIGSSIDINRRWTTHKRMSKSQKLRWERKKSL